MVATPPDAASAPDALVAAAERVGDRWTLQIVAALLDAPRPYGELQTMVGGIATNVLSQRLKQLEADALVVAEPYQQRPQRFVYALTARGRELGDVVRLLAQWGSGEVGVSEPVRHDACGTPALARWWCPTCERVVDRTEMSHLDHL